LAKDDGGLPQAVQAFIAAIGGPRRFERETDPPRV
jgi:hypothetical protein